MTIPQFTLPEGITSEPYRDYGTIIHLVEIGFCTIDWKRRDWRPGANTHVPPSYPPKYSGRDWAQRLIDAAVAELLAGKADLEAQRKAAKSA